MTSEVQPVFPATSLVQGSQALTTTIVIQKSGKSLPPSGKTAVPGAGASPLPAQIAQLNKYLNDSGRPSQFRASADNENVEEVNPATGEVVAEYSAAEFPALARSVGISGVAVDSRA